MNTLQLPAVLSAKGYVVYYLEQSSPEKHSHENLITVLSQHLGRTVTPEEVIRASWKKPYLADGSVQFSVTHSNNIWMVCLAPFPVGLDLQYRKDTYDPRVAQRWFHPEEAELLRTCDGDPCTMFHQIWCARESYAKYTGLGITGLPKDFSSLHPPVPVYPLHFHPSYWLYLCTNPDETIDL